MPLILIGLNSVSQKQKGDSHFKSYNRPKMLLLSARFILMKMIIQSKIRAWLLTRVELDIVFWLFKPWRCECDGEHSDAETVSRPKWTRPIILSAVATQCGKLQWAAHCFNETMCPSIGQINHKWIAVACSKDTDHKNNSLGPQPITCSVGRICHLPAVCKLTSSCVAPACRRFICSLWG